MTNNTFVMRESGSSKPLPDRIRPWIIAADLLFVALACWGISMGVMIKSILSIAFDAVFGVFFAVCAYGIYKRNLRITFINFIGFGAEALFSFILVIALLVSSAFTAAGIRFVFLLFSAGAGYLTYKYYQILNEPGSHTTKGPVEAI
jgi:hypothetical protein